MKKPSDSFKKAAVRSSAAIIESLMDRAAAQGRENQMRQKIDAIRTRVSAMPEGHESGLALARCFDEKCGNSQALRKLSLRTGVVYEDLAGSGTGGTVFRPDDFSF